MLLSTPTTLCGAQGPSEAGHDAHRALRAREAVSYRAGSLLSRQTYPRVNIQVYVHVIRDSEADNVPQRNIEQQINVLNEIYDPAEYSFVLAGSDATIIPSTEPFALGNRADLYINKIPPGRV